MVSPVLRSRFALASRLRAVFTAFAVNLAFLLAFLVAPLAISSPSYAAKGVVAGSEMTGFGRVVFAFDREVGAKVRTQNSVLVVEFDQAVTVDLDKLSAQLPGYISVARLDPDGKSLRFGMTERFKADLKPAGEKVYIDILSMRWQGLPPSLPVEVVQVLRKTSFAVLSATESAVSCAISTCVSGRRRNSSAQSSRCQRLSRWILMTVMACSR